MHTLMDITFTDAVWEILLSKAFEKTIPDKIVDKFHLGKVRRELYDKIASGEFSINPPVQKFIPKEDGSKRMILVNSPEERLLLSAVCMAYNYLYGDRLSKASKAYTAGLSCAKTVREVAKQNLSGYKLDLSKYFDSVPIEVINSCLDELDTGTELDKVVRRYYNDDTIIVGGKPVKHFKSLAQGCAVASFLANYVLKDVDEAMLSRCQYYCRYCDDMVLLGDGADEAFEYLKYCLAELGLSLNPNKVQRIEPGMDWTFLGFGIKANGEVQVADKSFAKRKTEVKAVCRKYRGNLKKMIRGVKRVFLNPEAPCYSWIYVEASAVNDSARIKELDKYCKDTIRACMTGSYNYTSNIHKIPNAELRKAGWVSLNHLYEVARIDRTLFEQEVYATCSK